MQTFLSVSSWSEVSPPHSVFTSPFLSQLSPVLAYHLVPSLNRLLVLSGNSEMERPPLPAVVEEKKSRRHSKKNRLVFFFLAEIVAHPQSRGFGRKVKTVLPSLSLIFITDIRHSKSKRSFSVGSATGDTPQKKRTSNRKSSRETIFENGPTLIVPGALPILMILFSRSYHEY